MFGGELIGIGIVLLVGIIMFVIYAVGLKYTYDRGTAPGQTYQGNQGQPQGANVYDVGERERTVGR